MGDRKNWASVARSRREGLATRSAGSWSFPPGIGNLPLFGLWHPPGSAHLVSARSGLRTQGDRPALRRGRLSVSRIERREE